MYKYLLTFIVIGFSVLPAIAQEPALRVSTRPAETNSPELIIGMQWSQNRPAENGLLVEIPLDGTLIPLEISRNGEALWLKNSPEYPDSQNVVHWQVNEQNIVLRFNRGLVQNGDQFSVELNAAFINAPPADAPVRISTLNAAAGESSLSGTEFLSEPLPVSTPLSN